MDQYWRETLKLWRVVAVVAVVAGTEMVVELQALMAAVMIQMQKRRNNQVSQVHLKVLEI